MPNEGTRRSGVSLGIASGVYGRELQEYMKPEGEPQDNRVCEFNLAFISCRGDGLERAGGLLHRQKKQIYVN